jgi:hypothetical protein
MTINYLALLPALCSTRGSPDEEAWMFAAHTQDAKFQRDMGRVPTESTKIS